MNIHLDGKSVSSLKIECLDCKKLFPKVGTQIYNCAVKGHCPGIDLPDEKKQGLLDILNDRGRPHANRQIWNRNHKRRHRHNG